ncbi:alpha/beta hydrolase fold domain-containing protein [Streptomyces griseus]|uniref:alpha/beta hydrolase fold domain-containing protein n=1 Tax=Streptomyces griseus TaxID=1911 RepID=UPI000A4DF1D1|nr:alpha/beta hydrolase fold domain-containing protein [Streptomyces griseus]
MSSPAAWRRVRIYTPVDAEAVGSGMPGLNGGYVLGSPDFCPSDLLRIADQVGAVVVSVDYRLARASLPGRTGGLLRRTGLDGRARRSWTSTRPGWPSAATARAVGSPRPWP